MHFKSVFSLILGLLFFCVCGFSASDRQEAQDNSADLYKQHLGQLSLGRLSKGQKKHLNVYFQIQKAYRKKQFDLDKIYDMQFEPVMQDIASVRKLLLNICGKCEAQAEYLIEQGNEKAAVKRSTIGKAYRKLADAVSEVEKIYPRKSFQKMNAAMNNYVDLELEMRAYKLKVPKREWLTNREAAKLISDWYKIKESRKKQRD